MQITAKAYEPIQLSLPFYGKQVKVDGIVDEARNVQYIGVATHYFDDVYRCLANVAGCLCVVEVRLTVLTR